MFDTAIGGVVLKRRVVFDGGQGEGDVVVVGLSEDTGEEGIEGGLARLVGILEIGRRGGERASEKQMEYQRIPHRRQMKTPAPTPCALLQCRV